MRNLAPLMLLLCVGFSTFSQVGINTTNPTTTLDVNGSIRVRGVSTTSSEEVTVIATKIIGVDDLGNFVDVQIGDNLILEANKIKANDKILKIGDVSPFNIPILSDVNLIILPGEPNEDKSVIRMRSILGNMIITGIIGGVDGQQIWLYPVTGDLTILPNSILSLFGNRIESNGSSMVIERYNMVRLMYDATRSKWIIMDH
ncbi:hypothetical protein ATE92_1761 [Ulvibacter sp. MAR_2010_11]|uniref:hypothetical protein n=1 Tax=Ulvibacter sp. MAR_2010_11 TaxID=1250229 RepID=UPI000C2CD5CA|nr:hypothetical protein [Ulvibacter sp. MAR_2010_11]PKA83602.1 hypothetical protein ATE92_1761 [Ulvibacter sp. MAR_2010_11]